MSAASERADIVAGAVLAGAVVSLTWLAGTPWIAWPLTAAAALLFVAGCLGWSPVRRAMVVVARSAWGVLCGMVGGATLASLIGSVTIGVERMREGPAWTLCLGGIGLSCIALLVAFVMTLRHIDREARTAERPARGEAEALDTLGWTLGGAIATGWFFVILASGNGAAVGMIRP